MTWRALSRVSVVLFAGLFLMPVRADAQRRLPEQSAEFWRQARSASNRRARDLLQTGLYRLAQARVRGQGLLVRQTTLETSILQLRTAQALTPNDYEIVYWLAQALNFKEQLGDPMWGRGQIQELRREIITTLLRVRQLDPTYHASTIAFDLGILYTKERDYVQAGDEYRRCVSTAEGPDSKVTAYSNLAEVTMMSGDLEGSVEYFEASLREAARFPAANTTLTVWGLAVALDRLGDHAGALIKARNAFSAGGMSVSELHRDGVFFEPEYEVKWYEALGYWAHAEHLASEPSVRLLALQEALAAFEEYLTEAPTSDRWVSLATRHANTLRRELALLAPERDT